MLYSHLVTLIQSTFFDVSVEYAMCHNLSHSQICKAKAYACRLTKTLRDHFEADKVALVMNGEAMNGEQHKRILYAVVKENEVK